MPLSPRKLFVAGATGATGRALVRLADARGIDLVPHVRPGTAAKMAAAVRPLPPRAAVFDLADRTALREALRERTTILQLVGTTRRRFASGDTYETSDVGTTRTLAEAGRDAGVDHFVLLSAVNAGRPVGAYLRAKARAEAIVRQSGIPWTALRPSAFFGEGHRLPPGLGLATRLLGLSRYRPIAVETLAATLLHVALARAPLGVALEGDELWRIVAEAEAAA